MISRQIYLRGLAALLLASALLPAHAADHLTQIRASQTLILGFVAGDAPFSAGTAEQPSGYAIELCGNSTPAASGPGPKGRDEFVQHHQAAAERVAQASGIPASFMIGQAGHETGWGKSEIKGAGGSNSFNLFGIKAGKGWSGKVAEITTTEYINGTAQKVTAKFRAYDSYEDSFKDYARLINNSPRYEQARAKTDSAVAYATELQKAGYATDPEYARKLSGAINSALRVQRAAQA